MVECKQVLYACCDRCGDGLSTILSFFLIFFSFWAVDRILAQRICVVRLEWPGWKIETSFMVYVCVTKVAYCCYFGCLALPYLTLTLSTRYLGLVELEQLNLEPFPFSIPEQEKEACAAEEEGACD